MRVHAFLLAIFAVVVFQTTDAWMQDSPQHGGIEEANVAHRERRGLMSMINNAVKGLTSSVDSFICNLKTFLTLAECCSSPAGPLVNVTEAIELASNCYISLKLNIDMIGKILKSYILAVMADNTGIVNLNDAKTVRDFGPTFCAIDCVFQNKSLIVNGALDYDLAGTVLSNQVSDSWKNAVGEAVSKCKDSVQAAAAITPNITVNKQTCYTAPALLVQCVRKALHNSCPAEAASTSKQCTSALANLQQCGAYSLPFRFMKKKSAKIVG